MSPSSTTGNPIRDLWLRTRRLPAGLVIALEPIVCVGSRECRQAEDGWTVASADGSLTAHHEHTIVITEGEPLVLTAA